MKKSLILTLLCSLFLIGLVGSAAAADPLEPGAATTVVIEGPNQLQTGEEGTFKVVVTQGALQDWYGIENAHVIINGVAPTLDNSV